MKMKSFSLEVSTLKRMQLIDESGIEMFQSNLSAA